ncbi:TAXI family TRAP transporter solute-binding subunit [Elioraea sp. Yellowstone]|jgi:TRAP transporter TAXI family solute receptor|uniref:TAXI family TRAP transporter solute-binding subunit n=1 Tax=Elioraea sp. Yellowstone TaxID=2592070 RepID=UPI00115361D3|nr:TAXI family TRAP transporter solute-binding subunit [Elioraea sp. Yellowstone]TQF79627.1 TAXI family TRAP transporter solute-binding subunit [Elioraea sp. Yellowstone]
MWTAIRAFLWVYALVALVVVGALAFAWRFVAPPPPREVVVATAAPGGAYHEAAEAWGRILAREGITLRLRPTAGSIENLRLLSTDPPEVDLALVQGGVGGEAAWPGLESLAAVFFEPLWVFVRGADPDDRLAALAGRRIAIGPEGSGTRALALELLAGNGVRPEDATLLPIGGMEAAEALAAGTIDAAMFVSARPTAPIVRLLRAPGVTLLDFRSRADAYVAAFPYLTRVTLPAGAVDLAGDLPAEDAVLVAPMAQVVAHGAIHPQIVALLMEAFTETHRGRQLFAPAGRFPSADPTDWPLNADAARYLRHGPGFLKRYLPFWAAVWIERMWVLVIPLLTIAIPLARLAPPLWRWQIDRKVYRWYRHVRRLEAALRAARSEEERRRVSAELDALADRVGRVRVPLSHAQPLYQLRSHIALIRDGALR